MSALTAYYRSQPSFWVTMIVTGIAVVTLIGAVTFFVTLLAIGLGWL